jgi:DNA polymerase III alpha subunit
MSWVPLHVHSQYSILDSTASVQALAKQAQKFEIE